MAKKSRAPRKSLADMGPMERARELHLDGEPLCERVAGGSAGRAIDEARARLARP